MTDPYKVLGVPGTATDEEVKKAYRELARKYHPDNYAGSDLGDLAEEKMKEINEAYDQIQKERAKRSSGAAGGNPYGGSGAYGSGGSYGSGSAGAAGLERVRMLIRMGRYGEAGIILDSVPQGARGAEWNYLRGCILLQRGFYYDAQKHFEVACYMEPGNAEYSAALGNMRNATAGQYGKTYTQTSGCSACDLCVGLSVADCLCECCGGDLISCC